MARIRTIKPEFWKNEKLGEMQCEAQLLFIGLWNLCDRRGFLEDRPKRIKAELFPYRDCNINDLLAQLEGEFIRRIEVNGVQYIHVLNFTKHQVINIREPESTVPEQYWNSTGIVPAHWEGKGREGKGTEGDGQKIDSSTILDYEKTKLILNSDEEKAWRELMMMLSPIKSEQRIIAKINEFLLLKHAGGFFPHEIGDTKRYFANWLRSQKIEPEQTERKSREKNPVI